MATSKPTRPAEIPQVFTPVPQRSDRANFAYRADMTLTSLPPTVDGVNENIDYVEEAVEFFDQQATAVIEARSFVEQGVQTVEGALEAIQSGPVSSVNGRSGIVTGLTETAAINLGAAAMSTAPLGQWASFSLGSGGGPDSPVAAASWWNVLTFGSSTRTTQIGHQVFNGNYQDWTFIRRKHDSAYGEWSRIFTDTTLIERSVRTEVTTGAVSCYPANGSLQFLILKSNTTITIPAPRAAGDQLTLRIYQSGGPWSIAFSSNVKLPVGASLPTMAASQWLTITLVPNDTVTAWHAFIGGIHAA